MSGTIADHGYIPEEHAPDPVTGHGDPTSPGKVGIWLFLASEIMFFIAILGTYIVLRSGSPQLFSRHALALSKTLAGTNTLVLIFSSLTMALAVDASQKGKQNKVVLFLFLTLACATGFLGIKYVEYRSKFMHYTVMARDEKLHDVYWVYDGHLLDSSATTMTLNGFRMKAPDDTSFDIHLCSEKDVEEGAKAEAGGEVADQPYVISRDRINTQIVYGPWKNVFYSCYFALTGIHGLHVIGGMIPITILLIQAMRGKLLPAHTEHVGLYWHFVDLVWIFLFPLLYLI